MQEINRILKRDGYFVFSAPFISNQEKTLTRARIKNGKVEYLLPAEYHGDPVNPEGGCLCFYHFGWDIVDDLKNIGFQEAGIYRYNSLEYGYLGEGVLLYAKK